jgi:hypothetical protein
VQINRALLQVRTQRLMYMYLKFFLEQLRVRVCKI